MSWLFDRWFDEDSDLLDSFKSEVRNKIEFINSFDDIVFLEYSQIYKSEVYTKSRIRLTSTTLKG